MASSCINTNDAGRPKVFSGKEEDFQPWAKKMEAFFGGKIKESAMMLEWAADQTTEITTELINREFLPTTTNQERGVQNLDFILQQMYTIFWTSRVAKQTTWSTTRGRTHWRRGQRLQERYDLTAGGRKRNILRRIISLGCPLSETPSGT